ncbi:MAG: hypothetical protein KC535_03210 [Nanoarchaeota archaeon]|nr:hypothetical protein [Nanoarchaeota archaeon]
MDEEVKKTRDLRGLKLKTDQQIRYLNDKATLTEEEIYTVTKDFFSSLLDLDYQFSHEELLDELGKTYIDAQLKKQIEEFIHNIGRIEYNSAISFEQDQLRQFLGTVQEVSDKLIAEETKQNSKGFSLFSKKQEKSLGELIEEVQAEPRLEKAKALYQEALRKYNELSQKDQQLYFDRLQEAYQHLKSSLS